MTCLHINDTCNANDYVIYRHLTKKGYNNLKNKFGLLGTATDSYTNSLDRFNQILIHHLIEKQNCILVPPPFIIGRNQDRNSWPTVV